MRITLLGHYDIASLYAMDRVLRGATSHQYSIFLSTSTQASMLEPLQQLAAVDSALCTQFLQRQQTSPLLATASQLSAPNRANGLSALRVNEPDLIVSIRYRHVLKESAIAIPRHGVINLHSGILPDYRGVMATFWAMLNSEADIGSTLHRITDSGVDTGPIIKISRRPSRPEQSYLANVLSLYDAGCEAILVTLETISRGNELQSSAQATNCGRYFSTPKIADLEQFQAKGLQLVTGGELEDLCRPDQYQ